jgi:8-oxo-dGTP diphosphatase
MKGIIRLGVKLLFNKRVVPGVPAIIRNSKGEILLGKRDSNMVCYPDFWGLPGGLIEYSETIEEAIKRELKEELGVNSEIIKYGKPIMNKSTKECPSQYLDTPVYCKIFEEPKPKDETSDVRWFKPKEIKDMKLAYNHNKILEEEGLI